MKRYLVFLFLTILFTVFSVCALSAQTWTTLPSNGTFQAGTAPFGAGWNKLMADGLGSVYIYARVSGCGDPFSNSMWSYKLSTAGFTRVWWSGGGQLVAGNCVQPIILPNPPGLPGDRHPYHQTAIDTKRNLQIIVDGVEDNRKCDNSASGTCTYQDAWSCDAAGHCTQLPTPPSKSTQGLLVYSGVVDDKYYFFPGQVGGSNAGKTYVLDPSNLAIGWVQKSFKPTPRNAMAGVWVSSRNAIFMFGGVTGSNVWLNDSWLYFPATDTWQQLTPSLVPAASRQTSFFARLAYDSLRDRVMLFTPTCPSICTPPQVLAYDFTQNNYVDLGITGGPQFITSGPPNAYPVVNAISWDYEPVSDSFIAWAGGTSNLLWQLKLPPPLQVSVPQSCDSGTLSLEYSCQLIPSGGKPPYTYSAVNLPVGLSLNSVTGLISGIPLQYGTFSTAAVTVTDSQ